MLQHSQFYEVTLEGRDPVDDGGLEKEKKAKFKGIRRGTDDVERPLRQRPAPCLSFTGRLGGAWGATGASGARLGILSRRRTPSGDELRGRSVGGGGRGESPPSSLLLFTQIFIFSLHHFCSPNLRELLSIFLTLPLFSPSSPLPFFRFLSYPFQRLLSLPLDLPPHPYYPLHPLFFLSSSYLTYPLFFTLPCPLIPSHFQFLVHAYPLHLSYFIHSPLLSSPLLSLCLLHLSLSRPNSSTLQPPLPPPPPLLPLSSLPSFTASSLGSPQPSSPSLNPFPGSHSLPHLFFLPSHFLPDSSPSPPAHPLTFPPTPLILPFPFPNLPLFAQPSLLAPTPLPSPTSLPSSPFSPFPAPSSSPPPPMPPSFPSPPPPSPPSLLLSPSSLPPWSPFLSPHVRSFRLSPLSSPTPSAYSSCFLPPLPSSPFPSPHLPPPRPSPLSPPPSLPPPFPLLPPLSPLPLPPPLTSSYLYRYRFISAR
ncbi:hypothetical protein C7M84_019509 [Penaeus vannamei]|uniref:Uncharacterized protein n=1 Tax=Penaeus vannamei TaxID=6689 RepID=A0A3R7PXL9_PENVA|nr:hypothetical protein C7M84_019509 [Penaeus vannamei]